MFTGRFAAHGLCVCPSFCSVQGLTLSTWSHLSRASCDASHGGESFLCRTRPCFTFVAHKSEEGWIAVIRTRSGGEPGVALDLMIGVAGMMLVWEHSIALMTRRSRRRSEVAEAFGRALRASQEYASLCAFPVISSAQEGLCELSPETTFINGVWKVISSLFALFTTASKVMFGLSAECRMLELIFIIRRRRAYKGFRSAGGAGVYTF